MLLLELEDDFGRWQILASPLPGRQLPVVSAYTRAKGSVITVRCHTRSLSQIRHSQAPRPRRDFLCIPTVLHGAGSSLATGVNRSDRIAVLLWKRHTWRTPARPQLFAKPL